MAVAGRRSRRFVIVKRFMGNYNVPLPRGGLSVYVQIRSYSRRNIKGAFTALFIRSAHKRRFTVLTHFLIPYFFFFLHPVRFRWLSRPSARRGSDEEYIKFRDQNGHLFPGDTTEEPTVLTGQ